MVIRGFALDEVKITEPVLENAQQKEQEYLFSIDADRLLAGFRETAGLPKRADRYPGGWENSELSGHTLGHYMVALAQLYKSTGSEEAKERLEYIVEELSSCQAGRGYLFTSEEDIFDRIEKGGLAWMPWYNMHKLITGLLAVYRFAGISKALSIAKKLGGWVCQRVLGWTDKEQRRVLCIADGGMNDCLYELYKETRETSYLEAAEKFEDKKLFETIAEGKDVLANKHANNTIPKFLGAVKRYMILGEPEKAYLDAAKKFFDLVAENHTYVTGGNGELEHFRTPGALGENRTECNCEHCSTFNMMKLAERLYFVTGESRYMDFYERAYFNAVLGAQNPENGMTTFFQPMAPGYFKTYATPHASFWCCTGTGMESFTKLNRGVYHKTEDGMFVNLYVSSELTAEAFGAKITQTVSIDSFDTVSLAVNMKEPKQFTLRLRIPEWTDEKAEVTVNNSAQTCKTENGYLLLDRTWKDGDQVELKLFPTVKMRPLADMKNCAAATYGPLVLAAGLGRDDMTTERMRTKVIVPTKNVSVRERIVLNEDLLITDWFANSNENFIKQEGVPVFSLQGTDVDGELFFEPYYRKYDERYGVYFEYHDKENLPEEIRAMLEEQKRLEEERRAAEEERLRLEAEEAERRRLEEEERKRLEEEERLRREAEEEAERLRLEEEEAERRRKEEEERKRLEEEERKRREAEAAALLAAEAARLAEEERRRKEEEERLAAEAARLAEEERLRKEEEERLAAEAARLAEEERLRREEEERLAAEAARLAEEERLRREAEEAERRRLEEEERQRREAEEAERRRLEEEERQRREAEEAERRRVEEEERKRLEEEERKRREAEEAERLRLEEEERKRREAEEAERRRVEEEERQRLEAEEAEHRRVEEEEKKRLEEEEAERLRIEAEEEEERQIVDEAKRIAAQKVADAERAAELAEAKAREEEAGLQAARLAQEKAEAEAATLKAEAEAEAARAAVAEDKARQAKANMEANKASKKAAKKKKKRRSYHSFNAGKAIAWIVGILAVVALLYVFATPISKAFFTGKDAVDTFLADKLPKVADFLKVKGNGDAVPIFKETEGVTYVREDAETFVKEAAWPQGYQASVVRKNGKQYICVEGSGVKTYYLNEIAENDSKHVYLEKGDRKALYFWDYTLDNPELLCPQAGVFNTAEVAQYAFYTNAEGNNVHILDADTLEECTVILQGETALRLLEVEDYTETDDGVRVDMTVDEIPYSFMVPKKSGATVPDGYTIDLEGAMCTVNEAGVRFEAYVVSAGSYLGKVIGDLEYNNRVYLVDRMEFFAYADEVEVDENGKQVFTAIGLTDAQTERMEVAGDRGERILAAVNDEVKRYEYDKNAFLTEKNGELRYIEGGKTISVKGIDVSRTTGLVDWETVAASGVEYAMIRLGVRGDEANGKCQVDANYVRNIKGAPAAGVEAGVYFTSRATTVEEAKEEAQFVLKNMKGYDITWPVALDTVEAIGAETRASALSVEDRTACAKAFMDEIAAAGYTPVLYTDARWSMLKLDLEELAKYDLWYTSDGELADYPYHYTMWQYTVEGEVPGIEGDGKVNLSFIDYGESKKQEQ